MPRPFGTGLNVLPHITSQMTKPFLCDGFTNEVVVIFDIGVKVSLSKVKRMHKLTD